MAELLVLAFEPGTTDDMAWRLGHVIDVKPDGFQWGTQERLPKFWLIKAPSVSVEETAEYMESLEDQDHKPVAIRRNRMNPSDLPVPLRRQLEDTGVVTMNKGQLISYFKRIR